jgi:RNA polymerase sigma-70 factor, ECF subfamily
MSAISHKQVLAAAMRGDDAALTLLVRTHHDRVYRFGLRVCRDGFDADDAVQEAFAKLAQRRDVVVHPGALSWLMSVVRNACLRMLRPFVRERRTLGERDSDLESVASELADPERAFERWQLVQAVHASIALLAAPYREVLILRDLEGLSGEETCRALGIELAMMKTRLHRARAQLRDDLLQREGGD